MSKVYIIISILFFFFYCSENNTSGFDYERDTPGWLKVKIDSMSSDPAYVLTKVYRYNYNSSFIYHIWIGLSSCLYCELYNQKGKKVTFNSDEELQDFLNKKKNEIIIWKSNP